MTKPDDYAFPTEDSHNYYHGLTKREYFAAMAMQGWLTSVPEHNTDAHDIALDSVELADALIEALNKPVEP